MSLCQLDSTADTCFKMAFTEPVQNAGNNGRTRNNGIFRADRTGNREFIWSGLMVVMHYCQYELHVTSRPAYSNGIHNTTFTCLLRCSNIHALMCIHIIIVV